MLIGFISDIHGNLPALEAAVADAKSRGASRIICAGDLTGYGPFLQKDFAQGNKTRFLP